MADFFQFIGGQHPTEVVIADVLNWRDHLRHSRKRAATVPFKLSAIRSFFEYLKAGGVIPLNPVSTKLVTPPELQTKPVTVVECLPVVTLPEIAIAGALVFSRDTGWESVGYG